MHVDYISSREAAQYLGVSLRTLYDWGQRGVFPVYGCGGENRYRINDLQRVIKRKRENNTKEQ